MKLLIDAGNTRIKWTVAAGDEQSPVGRLPTARLGDLGRSLARVSGVAEVWVSNVAGERSERAIRDACAARAWPVRFITSQAAQCGVVNSYAQPGQLGSDRWAALVAAWRMLGKAALVVNCGTATTIDALSAQGLFLGGVILPGVELMQRSVIAATAQLQPAEAQYAPFPKATADAVYSGAVQASCGAIERQYALLGVTHATVLLSGGAAGELEGKIGLPLQRVDDLVLRGVGLISEEADK